MEQQPFSIPSACKLAAQVEFDLGNCPHSVIGTILPRLLSWFKLYMVAVGWMDW